MGKSKTIPVLEKYYNDLRKLSKDDSLEEEKYFVCNVEFDLAKSLIEDFGSETATRIARLILTAKRNNGFEYMGNFATPTTHCYSPMYLDSNSVDNKYAIYCNK